MTTASSQRMPAVFFGHGSPMNTLESNRYTLAWRSIGAGMRRPAAILAISAHWYVPGLAVTAMAVPQTIHDFGGFPRTLFEYQYPAPGSPALAQRVRGLLSPLDVRLDDAWGLDHGTWSVLAHVFPAADIPVVQLSIDRTQSADFHYKLGRQLAPLRDEGILIIASGNVVHNLGRISWQPDAPAYDWALRFERLVRDSLERGEHAPLVGYDTLGSDARHAIPTPEHFLPLLYIAGLQRSGESSSIAVDGIQNASISMLTLVVGQD